MPPLKAIVQYWAGEDVFDVLNVIGCGEPVCFGCGWLSPEDEWLTTSPYLQRAHLRDRSGGGADTVDNIVVLCKRCHRFMPEFPDSRDDALAWVLSVPQTTDEWQIFTDARCAAEAVPFRTLESDWWHLEALLRAPQRDAEWRQRVGGMFGLAVSSTAVEAA